MKKPIDALPIVDVTGPDGNAFVLLGIAKNWAKQLGYDEQKLLRDMQSKDYEHLVNVFVRTFDGKTCVVWE